MERQTIEFVIRSAEGKAERLPALAAELVRLKVSVVVVSTTPEAFAAKQATMTIPIVMVQVGDPVGVGLIRSLAQPGGNITGLTYGSTDLSAKRLALLREVVPQANRVAVLRNPVNPAHAQQWKETQVAAQALRLTVVPVDVQGPDEFESAFAVMMQARAQALAVFGAVTFGFGRPGAQARFIELAAKHRVPVIYPGASAVKAGGLMAYGVNDSDLYRRAATYVDKVLRGVKPADLPVEQPVKFELAINLVAAKALGLTIPPSVLIRADQVVE